MKEMIRYYYKFKIWRLNKKINNAYAAIQCLKGESNIDNKYWHYLMKIRHLGDIDTQIEKIKLERNVLRLKRDRYIRKLKECK